MKLHKRIIAGAMSFLLFLGMAFPSGAVSAWSMSWPSLTNIMGDYQYGGFSFIQTKDGKKYEIGSNSKSSGKGTQIVEFPEDTEDFNIIPEKFLSETLQKEVKVTPVGETVDLSSPRLFEVYADDGRHYPFFMVGQVDNEFTEQDREARFELAEQLASDGQRWWAKINEIEKVYDQKKVEIGGYHPAHLAMLYEIGRGLWGMAAGVQSYRDKGASATEADYRSEIETDLKRTDQTTYRAETLKKLLDAAVPYYLNYVEEHRIANPDILSFSIGDSKGVVNKENKTVTIRMPEDTDWNSIKEPVVETEKWIQTERKTKLQFGPIWYMLTPTEETTGVTYDGQDNAKENGYGCGVNLSRQWTVLVEQGDPYNVITSFAVTTSDGSVRYGEINDEDHTINLNLPLGTDITAVRPEIQHTGTGLQVDGKDWNGEAIDFSHDKTLTVVNSSFNLQQGYTVHVTAEESGKNDILSYKIGDSVGEINGETISITVPYGTNLTAVTPEIEISEFAELTQVPDALAYNQELTYQVTAENRVTKTYTVTITEAKPSNKAAIKVFRIGGIQGKIDDTAGMITVEVPANIDITKIKPIIETVESGTVSPASGEVMDFTNPVTYTVTSQSGTSKRRYTVTVTRGATAENPYKEQMSSLVDKIIDTQVS